MNNIYFISDSHLAFQNAGAEKLKRQKLLDFFEYLLSAESGASTLYILGDLFDFWFEWYHVIPKYWFEILYRLRQLVDAGVTVNLVTGNHDFYPGQYLENEIGMRCFHEQHQFEIDSRRFFVAHGDGYAKKDRGYRLLKRIIRHPLSIFLYKTLISPDLGIEMARWTSHSSRKLVKIQKESWANEYYQFARQKFTEGFDYVILGHIHYPMIREEENSGKVYVNCGDWVKYFTYAQYDGSQLVLKTYPFLPDPEKS
ncbi:MAG: UDP-2,3-diacylglucosamine diphosphatase [Candidatus Omnitrophota bacterium]